MPNPQENIMIRNNSPVYIFNRLLWKIYGLRMKISKLTGLGITALHNTRDAKPKASFYALKAKANNGETINFEKYRGKKLLVVNLASGCGFTPQYGELQSLYQQRDDLEILGFPSNNFGSQEYGLDDEVAKFCKTHYHVTFPLFKKDDVAGTTRQVVYQWLTSPALNGWNTLEPKWNFYKYLLDEEGNLQEVFSSSVSPMDILK